VVTLKLVETLLTAHIPIRAGRIRLDSAILAAPELLQWGHGQSFLVVSPVGLRKKGQPWIGTMPYPPQIEEPSE
jgi:hypothetical protein